MCCFFPLTTEKKSYITIQSTEKSLSAEKPPSVSKKHNNKTNLLKYLNTWSMQHQIVAQEYLLYGILVKFFFNFAQWATINEN